MIEYENLQVLNKPFLAAYLTRFNEVMESGQFILGAQVREFEKEFANYCGSSFCLGVANGLDALTLSLRSFGFKEGSEVIAPSNTYIATILSILNANLKPVLVEPNIETYNICPSGIVEAITERTVAIVAVHLYGKCCAMDEILPLAQKFNLRLIEDCAQAHGAKFNGKKAGTFGEIAAFSFYPTKNLGALGDGGCVITSNQDLCHKVSLLRNYGSDRKDYNEVVGINSRLDELQAAFLRVKLKSLDSITSHKRKLSRIYDQGLKNEFIKPITHPDFFDVFHIYNIRHPRRDELREYLAKHGVGTGIHYLVSPHRQVALRAMFNSAAFPISDEIHATTLSLPISSIHAEDEILSVVKIMNEF